MLKILLIFLPVVAFANPAEKDSPEKQVVEQVSSVLKALNTPQSQNDCDCSPIKNSLSKIKLPEPIKKTNNVFDSVFLYDATPQKKALLLEGHSIGSVFGDPKVSNDDIYSAINLYTSAIGTAAPESQFGNANSKEESIALVEKYAPTLSNKQKMLFMSLMGSRASDSYTPGGKRDFVPEDRIWKSLKEGTLDAGICGNIHGFIGLYAKALGFVDLGSESGLWAQGKANNAGQHVVARYQDPVTKEYYIQNYGVIINTHQKTRQGALDVHERLLGTPGASLMFSQSTRQDGSVRNHPYSSTTKRWADNLVKEASKFRDQKVHVQSTFSNREQTFIGEYQPKSGDSKTKGFVVYSNYTAEDGSNAQYAAAGVAGRSEKTVKDKAAFDEMNLAAKGMMGLSQMQAPVIDPFSTAKTNTREALFMGGSLSGKARINSVTGKFEVSGMGSDFRSFKNGNFGLPSTDMMVGAEVQKGAVKTSVERHLEMAPDRLDSQNLKVQTGYDKIDIYIDSAKGKRKVYVSNHSQIYLLEGVENLSAIGIRDQLRVMVPSEKRGTLTIVGDASKIVKNRVKDTFYDAPASAQVSTTWNKMIKKSVEVGASGTLSTKNRPFYLFEDPSSARPEIGETRRSTNANVYMKVGW